MSAQSEASNCPVAIGEILAGKYRVDRVIGQGGMGIVVAATHVQLRQRAAIKFLLKGAKGDIVARFLREARAAAKLKSEHVARVLDVGELPTGSPFMVMEFLEGSDLEGVLAERGPLPVDEAVLHVLQACEAIAEAHAAGIVHRDLKPANLFLAKTPDGSGTVKVLDFGISKDTTEDVNDISPSLTRTTAVLGSPSYMAPEQMRSTRDANARADIWSLGVILYELLTGTVPFVADSFVELALKVISEEPPPPSHYRGDLPPALEAAILQCLFKDPGERFSSVAELAAAIAPFGSAMAAAYAERISRVQGLSARSGEASTTAAGAQAGRAFGATQVLGETKARTTGKTQKAGTISAASWAGTGVPAQAPSRWARASLLLVGGLVGGVAVLGGAAFALRDEKPSVAAPASAGPSAVVEKAPKPVEPAQREEPESLPVEAANDPENETEKATLPSAQPAPSAVVPAEAPPAAEPRPAPSPKAAKAPPPPRVEVKQEAPAPASKPAPAPPPKPAPTPKKNPLDIDIQ